MPQTRRRPKKHRSFKQVFTTTLICAAVSVAAIVMVLFFCGVRYLSLETADGGNIKFFGMVDKSGAPKSGKIVYSIGLYADVDVDRDSITYSNGDIYDGEFKGLLKDGKGKMLYANGDTYEGEWSGDMINGTGTYKFVNGDTYEGEFKFNTLYGEGKYTWPDGRIYEGYFENGMIVRVDSDNGVGADPGVIADTKN